MKLAISRQSGSALAMTLLGLSLMAVVILTLNKLVLSYHNSATNIGDYDLAQNAAKMALINAEQTVYNFDNSNGMEALSIAARVAKVESVGVNNCNNGWCYSTLTSWKPWLESANSSSRPCNSYDININGSSNALPWIDHSTGFALAFNTGIGGLCAQPRYFMELVNPAFTGRQTGANTGEITQLNGKTIKLYNNGNGARPARLYRITVRAYGRNGNTRVTLQEYVAIVRNTNLRGDGADTVSHQIIPVSVRWLYDD